MHPLYDVEINCTQTESVPEVGGSLVSELDGCGSCFNTDQGCTEN